eukprot:GHVH01009468.1.p1 GENE.GHVH01009468.1~~GHVH01009468.1.p1  ORF type:complete len:131 (-),score=6.49 GHVH01009468.1:275-667(-)
MKVVKKKRFFRELIDAVTRGSHIADHSYLSPDAVTSGSHTADHSYLPPDAVTSGSHTADHSYLDRRCLSSFQVLNLRNVLKHFHGDFTDNADDAKHPQFKRYCLEFFCHNDNHYPTVNQLREIHVLLNSI